MSELDASRIGQLRVSRRPLLVLCLCAAWCGTCREYRAGFDALAAQYDDCEFVWADVEDHACWVGDFEVDNFPTLLIQHGEQVLHYGVLLPHVSHLDKLLQSLRRMSVDERARWIAAPERQAWQRDCNWRAQLRHVC